MAGLRPFLAWVPADALYPPDAAAPEPRTVDLAGLLAARVMVVDGETVTVRDLIRQVANVEGGVHAGTPRAQIEHTLALLTRHMNIGGYPATIAAVRAVGRVALDGLESLRAADTR